MTADVERLLSAFLRDQDEIADLVNDRVVTVLPKRKEWPLIRVNQIDADPMAPLHIETVPVQVSCYGTTKAEARLVADTARDVMEDRLLGEHEHGVVLFLQFRGMRPLPDTAFEPPQPRWVFDVDITGRPSITSS